MSVQRTSLLEFPCDFPIKAVGNNREDLEALVASLARAHAPDLKDGDVVSRQSGGGRYLAVTVNLRARSQEQLDAIYRELSAHPEIIMVL